MNCQLYRRISAHTQGCNCLRIVCEYARSARLNSQSRSYMSLKGPASPHSSSICELWTSVSTSDCVQSHSSSTCVCSYKLPWPQCVLSNDGNYDEAQHHYSKMNSCCWCLALVFTLHKLQFDTVFESKYIMIGQVLLCCLFFFIAQMRMKLLLDEWNQQLSVNHCAVLRKRIRAPS